MLSGFDSARLRSLNVPVRVPLDCLTIATAFAGMRHLQSLTIKELSDSQDFANEFHHLGDGIMALSSSLRSLDISITNCNREEAWKQDAAFIDPGDAAFFFKKFFPEPSLNRIKTLVKARFDDPREPLDVNVLRSSKGRLDLERIRFFHVGLPWWAFQTVFNPGTIKELDLPMCQVAPNVWDDLGSHAQLRKLANINYEMLSVPFMSFLLTQPRLHFLSFARPPDIYHVAGTMSRNRVAFGVTEAAPHLGLGTEWGRNHARNAWLLRSTRSWVLHEHLIQSPSSWNYFENFVHSLSSWPGCQYPKKSGFLHALIDKTSLKHLVLPADMFDITPGFMACLASELRELESIELGFDYACPVRQSLDRPKHRHH